MSWNPFSEISHLASDIFSGLSKLPGSPENVFRALKGGFNNSLSWNPYSSRNSVWDYMAGGGLSTNGNNRKIGRIIGTLAAAYFGGGALAGGSWTAADSATTGASTSATNAFGFDTSNAFGSGGSSLGSTTAAFGGTGMIDPTAAGMSASDFYGALGYSDPAMSLGYTGNAAAAAIDTSSSSYYDMLLKKLGGVSGKDWARMGLGAYGLIRANQNAKMYQMPSASSMPNMPGYQAGLQAVEASQAAQGYTGSSNAAAAIGKYGADFYNQYVNQQLAMAQGQNASGMNQIGSLALLAGGMFGG